MKDTSFFEDPQASLLSLVMRAVLAMALLFLAGTVCLMMFGPLTAIETAGPVDMPERVAVVVPYEGPVWAMENARSRLGQQLQNLGVAREESLTIFPTSPAHLRPIAAECKIGFLLSGRAPGLSKWPSPLQSVSIRPGRRLVAWVKGQGNFTGHSAYRTAAQVLKKQGLQWADGERYELKTRKQGREVVEHWIPVK